MTRPTSRPETPAKRPLGDLRIAATTAWQLLRSGALFRGTGEWRRLRAKARWLGVRYLGVDEVVLPFEGMKLIARTGDYAIGMQVFVHGHFDRESFQKAIAVLRETRFFSDGPPLFFDVGANIGTHTLYALGSGLFSRVVSIEPEADNFGQLCRNLRINGFDTASAVNAAFSSSPGEGLLAVSADNLGDHRIVRGQRAPASKVTESIEFVDFATVCQRLSIDAQRPAMFWIDTQGHEFEVLSGIPEEQLRHIPFVIEYWPPLLSRNGTLDSLNALLGRVASRFVVLQDGRRIGNAGELSVLGAELARRPFNTAYVDLLCVGSQLDLPKPDRN